jgi:hypothetical protein
MVQLKSYIVLFILFCFWTDLIQAVPEHCHAQQKKEMKFRFPVILKGASWLQGRAIGKISAWSLKAGTWTQIPSQVDEVNRDGNYVLEGGLPFTASSDDGYFDGNDELSFKGGDLGQPFLPADVPSHIKASFLSFARFDVCGDRDGYLGSVLIAERNGREEAVKSYKPLFDPGKAAVESSYYNYRFRSDQPMLLGDVALKTKDGPKRVFVGSSFVMPLIPSLFLLPSMSFGEDDFTSEIESWRSGPVRSIVAVGAKLRKFFGMLNLHLFSELVFYEDFFQIPTKIEFVFDPSKYLDRGSGISYILKYPDDAHWHLHSNLDKLPPEGPKQSKQLKTAYDQSPSGVFSVRGNSVLGSFLSNVRIDQKALKLAPPPYLAFAKDFNDERLKSKWPWLKHSAGSLAVFIDISGVKQDFYDFALDVALSNQADDEFTDFQAVSAHWYDPTIK